MSLVSLIEKIHWSVAADSLPDVDETVHICMPGDDEPVWLGYFDGTTWITAEGFPIADGLVTYWAPMLKGPEAS